MYILKMGSDSVEKLTKDEAIIKIKEVMDREFSTEQTEIITHYGKPLSVIAGAGSGKTTVSIGHIFYLILAKGVKPHEILSITFSKKAALEIEERYLASKNNINPQLGSPNFKTFHAFFYSLLRNIPEYRGITPKDYTHFLFPLLKVVQNNGVKKNTELLESYMKIRSVLLNYGYCEDGLVDKNDSYLLTNNKMNYANYQLVMRTYNNLKQTNGFIDFDDMQSLLLEYLRDNPRKQTMIDNFTKSYKHVILDEYQDISPVQTTILDILMDNKLTKNLVTVGDDDQCIYEFRGSNPRYILDFLDRYKHSRRKVISMNYRCKNAILDEVIPMISNNVDRVDKTLQAFNEGGSVSYLDISYGSEFQILKDSLHADLTSDINMVKDVAVLVRFNKDRTLLADKLAEFSIPVDIVNTSYLLQNDKIYLALTQIAKAIKTRNASLMKMHSTKAFKGLNLKKLEQFEAMNVDFVQEILDGSISTSDEELACVTNILNTENAYVILSNTWLLIKDYYKYMIKMKHVNDKDVNTVVKYVLELVLDETNNATVSWEAFLFSENYKKTYLTEFIGDSKVFKIYTMHSVKGLEFSKVYLFGLSGDIVSSNDIRNYSNQTTLKNKHKDGVFSNTDTYDVSDVEKALSSYNVNVEEERRVFYVACTRAIDNLVIAYYSENLFALLPEMKNFNQIHQEKQTRLKAREQETVVLDQQESEEYLDI